VFWRGTMKMDAGLEEKRNGSASPPKLPVGVVYRCFAVKLPELNAVLTPHDSVHVKLSVQLNAIYGSFLCL
jgi:hypothetical protein